MLVGSAFKVRIENRHMTFTVDHQAPLVYATQTPTYIFCGPRGWSISSKMPQYDNGKSVEHRTPVTDDIVSLLDVDSSNYVQCDVRPHFVRTFGEKSWSLLLVYCKGVR